MKEEEEEEVKTDDDHETGLEYQISNIFEKKESQVHSGNQGQNIQMTYDDNPYGSD